LTDFTDLRDGGRRLAPLLVPLLSQSPLVLAVLPNGVPVAAGLREVIDVDVRGLPVTRSDDGAVAEPVEGIEGRVVIVVDDGVETGTVARAAAAALRPLGPSRLVLAVPVCSREVMSDLALRYDEVLAPVTPMGRRALTWHYAIFDTIDDETARSVLERLS
jgi:predicted phosphoribosyltransferase